jgi:L,D-transpeptidase ErfK/SrfK
MRIDMGGLATTAIAVICALADPVGSTAASYRLAGSCIGELKQYRIKTNESLMEVARNFGLGYNAIAAANPELDPWTPPAGSLIELPTAWILPDLPQRSGIVINLPELRLYYFPKKASETVLTFPLGIGDQGRATPVGSYRVIEKITNPAWHVPKTIRSELPGLPKVVPPGADNPLGHHALRLSRPDLLIHGTNRPWGIGRRSSHGCLRLYPEDIAQLFAQVPKGTRVTVINQPLKACAQGRQVFVEVHRPAYGRNEAGTALHLLSDKKLLARTDFAKLLSALEEMKGMPVDVTLTP